MSTPLDQPVRERRSFTEYLASTKETIEVFRWLYREITTIESRRHIRNLFFWLLFSIAVTSFQPAAVSYIFDGLNTHNQRLVIIGLASFFVSIVAQKIFMRYFERAREWIMGIHIGQLDKQLVKYFFEKSLGQHTQESNTLSPTTIDKGKWKAIDIQRIFLFDGIPTALHLGISIICLFFINWIAGLIMGGVFLCYVIGSLYLNSVIANTCGPLELEFKALAHHRNERMTNVERVTTNSKEEYEMLSMTAIYNPLIERDRKFWHWFIDMALIRSGINILGLVSVMSIGAWIVWTGQLSIGLLYPLFSWAKIVSENMWRLADNEHQINWHISAVKSMIAAVSLKPDIVESPEAIDIDPTIPHRIEFVDVSHTYPSEKDTDADSPAAIRGISFVIEPGENVSLLGPSGAGKTTVMKLLLRFSDPTSGKILIDGTPLSDISLSSWRRGIGYIPQQAQILDGTVRYNLVYGMSQEEQATMSDDELWKIMRLLKIDFGERLTNGLDTVVGKNGLKLSGGQAQRLMIGAAVIKKPWLLIIDEATSSLDSTTEREVQEGLATILAGQNTSALVVAHRLGTVRHTCDKHITLKPVSTVPANESQIDAIALDFESLAEQSPVFLQLATDQGLRFGGEDIIPPHSLALVPA